MLLPRSEWKLIPNYFKAKLVDDFEEKYINYLIELDGYTRQELLETGIGKLCDDWQSKSDNGTLELYQYSEFLGGRGMSVNSMQVLERDADYFEKEDDDSVIPWHLFKLVIDKT